MLCRTSRLQSECWSKSLLQLWNYDEGEIKNLTKADIVEAIEETKTK